jgi:HlyD family secretion protein
MGGLRPARLVGSRMEDLTMTNRGFHSSTELEKETQTAAYTEPPSDKLPLPPASGSRLVRAAVWVVFVAVICTGAALLYWRSTHALPQVHYETATVDRGTIEAKVTATGSLSALLTVQVGSQVSGRVQQLFVDYNSPVKKGQAIAKLDPLLFEAAVDQARALYLTAQSNLEKDGAQAANLKLTYDRYNQLRTTQVVSQSDFDTAQANYKVAEAQVDADESSLDSARAALNQAQTNLGYTTIVSPIDGIVISRSVDVGQTVAASFQAPTVFVIAQDLRQMQVDTNVSEADVGKLSPGMPVSFTVDAYPAKTFMGKLRQIRNAAQTVQNVVTYDAVINLENPNLLLKPGMTANVTFVVARKDEVVRIRNAALRFRPDPQLLGQRGLADKTGAPAAPGRVVWVLRTGKPLPVTISTGISDGTWTEVLEGTLQPGDVLLTDMTAQARRGLFSH